MKPPSKSTGRAQVEMLPAERRGAARAAGWQEVVAPAMWVLAGVRTLHSLNTVIQRQDTGDFPTLFDLGVAVWNGVDPYPAHAPVHNLNPPVVAIAAAALPLTTIMNAYVVWTVLSVCAFIAAIWLVRQELRVPLSTLVGLVFIATPGAASLRIGQLTGFLTLLVTLAWRASRRNQWNLAGGLVGLVILIKPFLAPIALVLVAARRWRACGAAIGTLVLMVLLSAAVLPLSTWITWFGVLRIIDVTGNLLNASIAGWIAHASGSNRGLTLSDILYSRSVLTWLWVAACGVIVATGTLYGKVMPDRRWALAILGALLISPLGWVYYLPLGLAPLIDVLTGSRLALVGLALVAVPWEIVPETRGVIGATLGSPYALGTLLLYVSVLAYNATTSPERLHDEQRGS